MTILLRSQGHIPRLLISFKQSEDQKHIQERYQQEHVGLNISRIFKILKSYCHQPGGDLEDEGRYLPHRLGLQGEKVKSVIVTFLLYGC